MVDRITIPTLIAAMETNISAMLTAYRGIDKISSHPAPWPYTHLAQTFLLFWVYTLPLCLVQLCKSPSQLAAARDVCTESL